MDERSRIPHTLGLRAGDLVEVRTEGEILSTLDEDGKLDGLPFMPEMFQFCGARFRVFRRAEKTCDTVGTYTSRRMTNAVHLEGLRCDGGHHGGCQAGCFLFWKEAWLKPLDATAERVTGSRGADRGPTRAEVEALTVRSDPQAPQHQVFMCQATELPAATTPIAWWDPRQYWRELRSGNVGLGRFVRTLALAWFNAIQRRRGGLQHPHVEGVLEGPTPSRLLDLQPGERVRVRPREEILATLNAVQKNRGLWFDVEQVPYCGGEFRVLRRVTQIINERTGRMMQIPGDCVILEGAYCQGYLSRNRLFCPRSVYAYWREIWLERVP